MADPLLTIEEDTFAVLTLNRPDKRNPLPYLPEHGLLSELERLKHVDKVRVLILTGAGKAFSSGLDLSALKALQTASPKDNLKDSESILHFFETLRTYPKPILAAVNGPAVAGGAGLALFADWVVAADTAYFRFSEVAIGFVPALVGVYLSKALGDRTARDLLLSARKVMADEARTLGLANETVAADKLLDRARQKAREIAQNSPEALQRTKAVLSASTSRPFEKALAYAKTANAESRETSDCKEGIQAFLEKRKPNWQQENND